MPERHLLVVDDQPEMSELVRKIAEPMGFKVTTTSNPEKAVTLCKEIKPDVIFLDIVMPNKDGIEVVIDLAKSECMKSAPLLILASGSDETYLSAAAKIAQGNGWQRVTWLTKPFTAKQMREALSTPASTASAS